jgi:hypothetical protein
LPFCYNTFGQKTFPSDDSICWLNVRILLVEERKKEEELSPTTWSRDWFPVDSQKCYFNWKDKSKVTFHFSLGANQSLGQPECTDQYTVHITPFAPTPFSLSLLLIMNNSISSIKRHLRS